MKFINKFGRICLAATIAATASASVLAKNSGHADGPFDLSIANEDRLLDMLRRSGKISADATVADAQTAVKNYIEQRRRQSQVVVHDLADSVLEKRGPNRQLHRYQKLQNQATALKPAGKANGCANQGAAVNGFSLPCVEEEPYTGPARTAKILTVLIEFPDFPHNSVESWETDMYYRDYNTAHYTDLLFSDAGFSGPNGENLITMKQYYEQQSGSSYSVSGQVAGWYMAQHPAAFYGNNVDGDARALVTEALLAAAADPSINLEDFDIEDRYDLDGDGDLWEPDGLVDHVQIIHSSVGEESGGGQIGEDAVWSHRWSLAEPLALPGTESDTPYWDGVMVAYDYTIQSIDAAPGVICHEYGHDLGLPDEYDTQYSGAGEPISHWSIMSSGSWSGTILGTEPSGFSAWAKEFLQAALGGNWLTGTTFDLATLPAQGRRVLLDQAVTKGTHNDAVRINLPDKLVTVTTPVSGEQMYFSGSGDNLGNAMTIHLDLSAATTAELNFKTWFDIETDWDYAYVLVNGEGIAGNITSTNNPNEQNFGNGITGSSMDWMDASFDLSAYAGQVIELTFYYWTDGFVTNPGFYADDITITADASVLVMDDAESEPEFELAGFTQNPGYSFYPHYYLAEWRTHQGVDVGLAHVRAGDSYIPFIEGLLLWYVDTSYTDNWVGYHPGEGFLGVVDADQKVLVWSDEMVASTRYQVHDAAFNNSPSEVAYVDLTESAGVTLIDDYIRPHRLFNDKFSYLSPEIPDAGRTVENYGLKIMVMNKSPDNSVALIKIFK